MGFTMAKTQRWVLAALTGSLLAYALLVAGFELSIGLRQPESDATLVIYTNRTGGSAHQRVLARLQHEDQLYVAVNHWPRAWYRQALEYPEVRVTVEGETGDYRAVPVGADEHQILQQHFPLGLGARFMMGFPPRHFLRLEPLQQGPP